MQFGSVTRLNETVSSPPPLPPSPEELVCPDPGDVNSDDLVNVQDIVDIIDRILK